MADSRAPDAIHRYRFRPSPTSPTRASPGPPGPRPLAPPALPPGGANSQTLLLGPAARPGSVALTAGSRTDPRPNPLGLSSPLGRHQRERGRSCHVTSHSLPGASLRPALARSAANQKGAGLASTSRSPPRVRLRAAGAVGPGSSTEGACGAGPGVGDVKCRYCAIRGCGASAALLVLSPRVYNASLPLRPPRSLHIAIPPYVASCLNRHPSPTVAVNPLNSLSSPLSPHCHHRLQFPLLSLHRLFVSCTHLFVISRLWNPSHKPSLCMRVTCTRLLSPSP